MTPDNPLALERRSLIDWLYDALEGGRNGPWGDMG